MKSKFPGILAILVALMSPVVAAQEEQLQIEGGSFVWNGQELKVEADTLARHYAIIGRVEPDTDPATRLERAWARAIRLEGARAAGLELDETAFRSWMRERHATFVNLVAEGELRGADIGKAWSNYVRERGFADPEEYEAACREEYLGERFVALEFPDTDTGEAALRQRFTEMHTAYEVSALVFAPETLERRPELDQKDEAARALFGSWWQTLPEQRRRIYDDRERPASEVECLFYRFSGRSRAEVKEFFERKRPTTGDSLAEATAHYVISPLERHKMGMRWLQNRRTTYAQINGELPTGLDDEASFELVQDHLDREWRILRYLGDLWRELKAAPVPADVAGAALHHGFEYRHYDLQTNYKLQEDLDGGGVLVGDHPLGFRRTKPGEIFDYNTRSESPEKVYYVEGVVDQPGLHASIWRLIRFEGQRVLSAEQGLPLAWKDFLAANDYRLALDCALRFAGELERRVNEEVAARSPEDGAARARIEIDFARREFADYFDQGKSLVKQARVIGPFVARPFEPITGIENERGQLEQRVLDFVDREWTGFVGPIGSALEEGQVLPMARSDRRGIALMLRIDKIHRPSATLFDRDPAGRERARVALATDQRASRAEAAARAYSYPAIVHHFKLAAPQLDRLMSERIKKGLEEKR